MDSTKLQIEFEKQAQKKYAAGDYTLGKLNHEGQRIDIEIMIERDKKRTVSFLSGWMIRKKGLLTNNTPLGG